MTVCTGRGGGNVGDGHCCWIAGKVCQFLTVGLDTNLPRCSVWDEMDSNQWHESRVGHWFAETYPGFDCKDWPQNIPEVMAEGIGLCCWAGG